MTSEDLLECLLISLTTCLFKSISTNTTSITIVFYFVYTDSASVPYLVCIVALDGTPSGSPTSNGYVLRSYLTRPPYLKGLSLWSSGFMNPPEKDNKHKENTNEAKWMDVEIEKK